MQGIGASESKAKRENLKSFDELNLKLPKFLTNLDPSIYESNNYVVLDWETTNLDKGFAGNQGNRIILGTWIPGTDHKDYRKSLSQKNRNGILWKLGNEFE